MSIENCAVRTEFTDYRGEKRCAAEFGIEFVQATHDGRPREAAASVNGLRSPRATFTDCSRRRPWMSPASAMSAPGLSRHTRRVTRDIGLRKNNELGARGRHRQCAATCRRSLQRDRDNTGGAERQRLSRTWGLLADFKSPVSQRSACPRVVQRRGPPEADQRLLAKQILLAVHQRVTQCSINFSRDAAGQLTRRWRKAHLQSRTPLSSAFAVCPPVMR